MLFYIIWNNLSTHDIHIRKLRTCFAEDTSMEIVTLNGRGYFFLQK
ncbi:MAG: hypothetical protein FWG22_00870 [Prolixibacteraceae bacterium]|nr:hypothetical protein [Prolixibacteraceae bacterium]